MNTNDRDISVDELDEIMHPTSLPRIGSARAGRQEPLGSSERAVEPSDSHGRAAAHNVWTMEELSELSVQDIPRPAKNGEGEPGQQRLLSGRAVNVLPGLDDIVKQVSEIREVAESPMVGNPLTKELCTQVLRLASILRYIAGDRG